MRPNTKQFVGIPHRLEPNIGAPAGDDLPLAPVPCPRMNHRVALKGNVMYVYGGLFEPEESVRAIASVFRYGSTQRTSLRRS